MTANSHVTRCTNVMHALAILSVAVAFIPLESFAQGRGPQGRKNFQLEMSAAPTRGDVWQKTYMRERHNPTDTNGG